MSVATPQKVLSVILQADKRVDIAGTGADLLSGVIREGIEIALGIRSTAQQRIQIGIMLYG